MNRTEMGVGWDLGVSFGGYVLMVIEYIKFWEGKFCF